MTTETWLSVEQLGRSHGVAGHLASCLACAGTEIDGAIVGNLRAWSEYRLVKQLGRRSSAATALTALGSAGLEPILIKGYALAEEIYGSLSARAFGDCDVLVRERDFEAARTVLRRHGYADYHQTTDQPGSIREGHALELIDRSGAILDLHWRLSDAAPAAFETQIWAEAEAPSGRGRLSGLRLSPEMTLIHLADHFRHHDFQSIKPLIDFYMCAEILSPRIDVDRLDARAAALGLGEVLEMTLLVCRAQLRPTESIDRLLSRTPSRRAIRFAAGFDPETLLHRPTPVERWRAALDRRLATAGLLEVLRWMRPWVFPGKQFLQERFGPRHRWSHYGRYYGLQAFRIISRSRRRLTEFGR